MKRLIYLSVILFSALLTIGCHKEKKPKKTDKMLIYQVFTRLFGSDKENTVFNGNLSENGVGKFDDFTSVALDSIAGMGMSHIWYTGVIEHASIYTIDTVGGIQKNHPSMIKGKAGSPYAIKDYYDVNAYLANNIDNRMAEFDALIKRTHDAGLGVIIDFVPNHVARGYHSDSAPDGIEDFGASDDQTVEFLASNNYYYLPDESLEPTFDVEYNGIVYKESPAKVTGNDQFTSKPQVNDWYETIKLNYGVDYKNGRMQHFDPIPDTWLKMRDILMFWSAKGVDGFRCDMAEMVPVEFWGWVIAEVNELYPDIFFIAEIYNPAAYEEYIFEGRFDYLYDKVGLYDSLKSVIQGKSSSIAISKSREKVASVQQYMLNFLENHDEQRIPWFEFAGNAEAGLPMMLVSTLSDSIPMMIYFGQEIGVESPDATGFSGADGRTTIFDFYSMPEYQKWRNNGTFDGANLSNLQKRLRKNYVDILEIARWKEVFMNGAFVDLTMNDKGSSDKVYAFIRHNEKEAAIVVSNLSDQTVSTSYTLPKELQGLPFEDVLYCNNRNYVVDVNSNGTIYMEIPPYQAMILKSDK